MNSVKAVKQNLAAHIACYSFRGHDFLDAPSGTALRRHAKRLTRRALRRLGKALTSEV